MTPTQLALATGARIDRATEWLPSIEQAMAEFSIDNRLRQAAFLAQIGHESGGLHWLVELWGPTEAQRSYEGRKDLGNTQPGDGYRFRGRGLLQTTGRANYATVGDYLGVDLTSHPEWLAEPQYAARSAGWYWHNKALNDLADKRNFVRITRLINGGTNGLEERYKLYYAALNALPA